MRKFNNKNIILSVVALLMIAVLTVGISFSWIEGGNKTFINSNEITITTGSNLTVRYDGMATSAITIPVSSLQEVSSADGRSFFIPMDNNKKNAQASMTFRTGTPNDENKKYVSLDFQIEAGDSETHVYLGSGTVVQCVDPDINKALRMAFYENDGSDPIVFRPSQMAGTTDGIKYYPIVAIDKDGKVNDTTEVTTEAYGKYYFQGLDKSENIFDLSAGEVLNVTMVLWLEGTEIDDTITEQDININIEFTTNSDDLIKYTFIDNCHNTGGYYDNDKDGDEEYVNNWIHHVSESKYETMMYVYDYANHRYYLLSKQNNTTWMGYVSSSVSEFVFRRYSIYDDTYWNEWEPSIKDIPTISTTVDGTTVLERTFVAISGHPTVTSGANIRGCYGYWKDAKDTIRIYFENKCEWNDLRCYAWTSAGDHVDTGEYPGAHMEHVKDKLYYIDLSNGSDIVGIKFSNGPEGTIVYIKDDMFCTGTTYGYMHRNNSNFFLGGWPGQNIANDAGTGLHKVSVRTDQDYGNDGYIPKSGDTFEFITTNNYDNGREEKPSNNTGKIGKSYTYSKNTLTEIDLSYRFGTDDYPGCIFNGSVFSYLNKDNVSFRVYTDEDDSLIYPVNVDATKNQ